MQPLIRQLSLIVLLGVFSFALQAKRAEYHVKALGLRVASLTIERNLAAGTLEVKTISLITNAIFPAIDNTYTLNHNAAYLPLTFFRKVRQDKLIDDVRTTYDHSKGLAKESHTQGKKESKYKINSVTRDFFSLIAMLSDGKAGSGTYELDANGSLWQAKVTYIGSKVIKTDAGKFSTKGYRIILSSTHEKAPYVDMVTNNLFHKNSRIDLWVDGQGLVVKASMKKGAMVSNWELKEIRE